MAGSQMFDQLERAAAARTHVRAGQGSAPTGPGGTRWLLELTGATARQIPYWARKGILGPDLIHIGSGHRRNWTEHDVEVVHALVQLAAMGATDQWLRIATRAVRAGRVNPAGERLVLLLDGTCFRHPADQPLAALGPAWIVPLMACPYSSAGDPLPHCSSPAGDPPTEGAA